MNEEEKGRQYQSLMNHYVGLENALNDIPKLSLEEQMKQVDVTNKMMYNESNLRKVNDIRMKMVKTREEATKLHI
tara:strand:+ start:196 stop:420 length:225 start_codon:yes stop_codon:yes gene_type:complete